MRHLPLLLAVFAVACAPPARPSEVPPAASAKECAPPASDQAPAAAPLPAIASAAPPPAPIDSPPAIPGEQSTPRDPIPCNFGKFSDRRTQSLTSMLLEPWKRGDRKKVSVLGFLFRGHETKRLMPSHMERGAWEGVKIQFEAGPRMMQDIRHCTNRYVLIEGTFFPVIKEGRLVTFDVEGKQSYLQIEAIQEVDGKWFKF